MSYTVIPPCRELQDFVSHFWVGNWSGEPVADTTYYLTANSLTELAFAFEYTAGHPELLFSSVQGQTNQHGQFAAGDFYELFGVSLFSYAIPCFFDVSLDTLNNQFVSVETLLGNAGNELTERIVTAATTEERVNILSAFFIAQLKKRYHEDRQMIEAVRYIRRNIPQLNVKDLSAEFCLSQKQFERRFKAFAGFNPKMYSRIVRFESVLHHRNHYSSLTEAAYANGYYDQAHFIHDFKKFSGYSPQKFFRLSKY